MNNFRNIIRTALFTPGTNNRWGIPLLFEADPGTAKTSIINTFNEEGLTVITLLGSVRDPSDIAGLPIEVNGVIHRCPDTWVKEAIDAKRCVVFCDELNTSAPAVQAALLRVIFEGVCGDETLPPTVRFLAAQNPTDQAAGGWDLAPPLANRFGHLAWQAPSTQDWGAWLLGNDDNSFAADAVVDTTVDDSIAEAIEAEVLAAWPAAWAKARGQVAAFVNARPELLHKMPSVDSPDSSKAWPSRRTWEMAARCIAGAEVHKLNPSDADMLMAACIGTSATAEFATWRAEQDLPAPADVLDGKVAFGHDARRLDRTSAVLSACAAFVADPNCADRAKRASMMWKMLGALVDSAADLTVGPCRVLLKAGLGSSPDARPTLAKLEPMLRAAGLR